MVWFLLSYPNATDLVCLVCFSLDRSVVKPFPALPGRQPSGYLVFDVVFQIPQTDTCVACAISRAFHQEPDTHRTCPAHSGILNSLQHVDTPFTLKPHCPGPLLTSLLEGIGNLRGQWGALQSHPTCTWGIHWLFQPVFLEKSMHITSMKIGLSCLLKVHLKLCCFTVDHRRIQAK